jgi:hypothetical protein
LTIHDWREMKWKNLKLIITLMIILKRLTILKSVNSLSTSVFILKHLFNTQSKSETKKTLNIVMIEVVVYWTLVKKKKIKIFSLIISKINKVLSSDESSLQLNKMIFVMSLKKLKNKLSIVYYNFLNVFNKEKTTQLSLHWSYDHKIKLKDESQLFRSQLYFMLSNKL